MEFIRASLATRSLDGGRSRPASKQQMKPALGRSFPTPSNEAPRQIPAVIPSITPDAVFDDTNKALTSQCHRSNVRSSAAGAPIAPKRVLPKRTHLQAAALCPDPAMRGRQDDHPQAQCEAKAARDTHMTARNDRVRLPARRRSLTTPSIRSMACLMPARKSIRTLKY